MKTTVVPTFLFLLCVLCIASHQAPAQGGWAIRMNGLPTGTWPYVSASMPDSATIWVSGAGSVYRTTDLGLTWVEANRPGDSLGLPQTMGTVSAWDALGAVMATSDGRIFRTSDGGMTWHRVFEDTSVTIFLNDMEMVTDSVGYAIGDGTLTNPPAVVKTTDAGWIWEPVGNNLPVGCYSWFGPTTDFISPQVGWSQQRLSLSQGGLFKTTDGGVTWNETSAPTGYGVCFIDDSIGLTSPGVYSPYNIHRTTDGGLTWQPRGVNGDIYVLASPDGARIWCASGEASDDSGTTWYDQSIPAGSGPTNGAFHSKDIGVLVGAKVLVTTTGGNEVVDVAYDRSVPATCALSQNYPNPFNPSTTIRYALPAKSHVTLAVFNTLGQRVDMLVQGEQEAGYHEIQFDASGLASGVYLCQLRVRSSDSTSPRDSGGGTGDFVQTRRLVVL